MATDILVHNGRIYCSGREGFTWMTFNQKTGYISKVGKTNPPLNGHEYINSIDLNGKRVLPGLQESHLHLGHYAASLVNLNLYNCASVDDLQDRLSKYLADNPSKKWIVGQSWEQDKIGRYPTLEDLDQVCSDRPVLIMRICVHIVVVNTAALKILGIDRNTPNPPGMQYDRFPDGHVKAGEPNGILREASEVYRGHITPTKSENVERLKVAIKKCLEFGITTCHTLEEHGWDAFCELADTDQLPLRIVFVPYYSSKGVVPFPGPGESRGPMLHCDRIKLFTDGALGPCTAALSHSYKGTNNKGLLLKTQEEMTDLVSQATAEGYRLEIHTIGDAAAELVLNSLEQANVAPERRPILVHCQILRPDLIPRLKAQGVIASIQPQFVLTDARWLDQLLPDELNECLYPWKTLLDAGIRCCGGSDAPVESPEPLVGIYDAIFRPSDVRGPDNKKCFRPAERLSVKEAIDLYTVDGAYAALREHNQGQLLPGYQADFIVLDASVDVCDHPEEFYRVRPSQVWVAGARKL